MQREITERLPNHLVRHRPRTQQPLQLIGGGDLENTERAKDVGAQRGGRAVRVGDAVEPAEPSRPGRLGRGGRGGGLKKNNTPTPTRKKKGGR
ncbi:hypothetical protein, partial [Kitasatospora sp. NPDC056184]|uniref:hypothetical protein n=1 Tax=Kitasatospora sp. NPDC056184 TaxID=3345738 RepID=UPI0035D8FB99